MYQQQEHYNQATDGRMYVCILREGVQPTLDSGPIR